MRDSNVRDSNVRTEIPTKVSLESFPQMTSVTKIHSLGGSCITNST